MSPGRIAVLVSLERMSRSDKAEVYLLREVARVLKREVFAYMEAAKVVARGQKEKGPYRLRLAACLQLHDLDAQGESESEITSRIPYLEVVKPRKDYEDGENLRKRLAQLRARNVRLFDQLQFRVILMG